jgi:uncharacterized protein YuzE
VATYRFTDYFENEVLRKENQLISASPVQAMELNYYPETDSLYIHLSEHPSAESREISEGVVLDYDAAGVLVAIDIDNASAKADIHRLVISKLPAEVETIASE